MNYDEFHGRVDITNITARSLNVIYRVESHFIKPTSWAPMINEILHDHFYTIIPLHNML